MATGTEALRGSGPAPRPTGTRHPQLRVAAPEGLALDAHALRQAAQEGGGALLHNVLHAQPPLDVLQQPPEEAQEVLGRADGARHRLCGEEGSAAKPQGEWGRGQVAVGTAAHPAAPRRAAQGWPGARWSPGRYWPPAALPPGAGTPPADAARRSP